MEDYLTITIFGQKADSVNQIAFKKCIKRLFEIRELHSDESRNILAQLYEFLPIFSREENGKNSAMKQRESGEEYAFLNESLMKTGSYSIVKDVRKSSGELCILKTHIISNKGNAGFRVDTHGRHIPRRIAREGQSVRLTFKRHQIEKQNMIGELLLHSVLNYLNSKIGTKECEYDSEMKVKIPRIYTVGIAEDTHSVFGIMERIEGVTVNQFVSRNLISLSDNSAQKYLYIILNEICDKLMKLQKVFGLVHKDLNINNVIVQIEKEPSSFIRKIAGMDAKFRTNLSLAIIDFGQTSINVDISRFSGFLEYKSLSLICFPETYEDYFPHYEEYKKYGNRSFDAYLFMGQLYLLLKKTETLKVHSNFYTFCEKFGIVKSVSENYAIPANEKNNELSDYSQFYKAIAFENADFLPENVVKFFP